MYKKQIVQYLEKKGYFIKASSSVEAIFADCILTKKGEEREYWLEVKATTVSLRESSFLSQMGKYLAEYIVRTRPNRFRMMLACYRLVDLALFQQVFEKFEMDSIRELVKNIVEASESNVKSTLNEACVEDIKQFFEDAVVIEANPLELQVAETKIAPIPPKAPSLSDAEYAAEIMKRFGDVEPLKGPDKVLLNLFMLSIPKKLCIGKTSYRTPSEIFGEKPNTQFPAFRLESGNLYSFNNMNPNTLLGEFVDLSSVREVRVDDFEEDENQQRILIKILNTWTKNKCRRRGLWIDPESQAYFFPKKPNDQSFMVSWRPRFKISVRELTKPMLADGKINFWVHRAAEIFAKKFWGCYYVQIRPRLLFSPDGLHPFEGDIADKLDRAFRKSRYTRNLNQLYDVLFWYRYMFSQTDVSGNIRLDSFDTDATKEPIAVIEQAETEAGYKPNIEIEEEVEQFDKIDQFPSKLQTLDDFV